VRVKLTSLQIAYAIAESTLNIALPQPIHSLCLCLMDILQNVDTCSISITDTYIFKLVIF